MAGRWLLVTLIALGGGARFARAQDLPTVKFGGELRLRGEWDGRTVDVGDDAAVLSRVRLGVRADIDTWLGAFVQLQDARAWGTATNTLTDASADFLDMHQGYADVGTSRIKGRLGRQEVNLGDQRLVGAVGWSNTGRAFDGVRLLGNASGIEWTAFWMSIAERDELLPVGLNPQLNQGIDDDGWLIGGFVSTKAGASTFELTGLVDRKALTDAMYTVNLRAHGGAGPMTYDAAGAYQFGPDRGAFLATAKLGVAFAKGSVAAQVDYLSGDDDPADADLKAFNTLYATNHKFYGYMDYFLAIPEQLDEAGLIDAVVRGSLSLPKGTTVRLDLHRFSLAKERGGSKALGTELDVVGSWKLHTLAALELGGGLFLPEDLATTLLPAFANGDEPAYWGYAQLVVRWP
jgi:hypothetical protein